MRLSATYLTKNYQPIQVVRRVYYLPAVDSDGSIVGVALNFLHRLNQVNDGRGLRRARVIWPKQVLKLMDGLERWFLQNVGFNVNNENNYNNQIIKYFYNQPKLPRYSKYGLLHTCKWAKIHSHSNSHLFIII